MNVVRNGGSIAAREGDITVAPGAGTNAAKNVVSDDIVATRDVRIGTITDAQSFY